MPNLSPKPAPAPHTHIFRVLYADTDQMGYMYYGNYARYFEVGRVEALRARGISYAQLEALGYMLPVLDFACHYHRPARYDQECMISTTVERMEGARVFFVFALNDLQGKLLATATVTLVSVKAGTMRPCPVPDVLREAYPELP